jgi:H+/gluconate symporter-like permease
VRIDDERDLHEGLEAALEAISPHPAPIEGAIRRGKAIKGRRRAALAIGVAAVAVAGALAVPSLVHRTASPPRRRRPRATR